MEFSYEDLQEAKSASSQYTPLVPPIKTWEDGTLEITDFVTGIDWTGFKYNEEKAENGSPAVFTFSNKDGDSIGKFMKDPLFDPKVTQLSDEDPDKKIKIGRVYSNVINDIAGKFLTPKAIETALVSMKGVKEYNLRNLAETLFEATKNPENLQNTDDLSLKVVFQASTGVSPKFTLPMFGYLGKKSNSKFKFNTEGQYADKLKFIPITGEVSFSADAPLDDSINTVFTDEPDVVIE